MDDKTFQVVAAGCQAVDTTKNVSEEASGGGEWDDEEYLAAYFFS